MAWGGGRRERPRCRYGSDSRLQSEGTRRFARVREPGTPRGWIDAGVQALTATTIFPCYVAADRALAERFAVLMERGADVRIFLHEGEMQPGGDLAEKAREGRMADIVIVFFSRDSMPSRWPRVQWEGALVTEPAEEGVRIAFVKCDDCIPPRVLAPLFEASRLREVKRWIRAGAAGDPASEPASSEFSADLEVLGIAIADRPGAET